MSQTSEYDIGNDIDRNWILDEEGDLKLVGGSDNLTQAIYNRLTCYLDDLEWCYTGYGSTMKSWLGRNNTSYNRKTLEKEIKKRVSLDPRVSDVTAEIVDYSSNFIGVCINAVVVEDNSLFEEYFIFSNTARNTESNYSNSYHDTYITSRRYGYFAKPGELLSVHCHVLDKTNDLRVPIGMVSCFIGGYHVDTLMIEQSGADEPASVTFTLRVPLYLSIGEHELIFKYNGILGFNPSEQSFAFYVVDKYPTVTSFLDDSVYTAGIEEDAVTINNHVIDYNGLNVEYGEIEYSVESVDDASMFRIGHPVIYYNGAILSDTVTITTTREISKLTKHYVFELNRMFNVGEIIILETSTGALIDKLLVRRGTDKYILTSTTDNVNSTSKLRLM